MDRMGQVKCVRELCKNTPDGVIIDADTILKDIMNDVNFEETGIAEEILEIWEKADTGNGHQAVEELFLTFTGIKFEEYLKKCMKEITRK